MVLKVGEGILSAMAARGDHPLADSVFSSSSDGSSYERGLGKLGYYHASNASGTWEIILEPFAREIEGQGVTYTDLRRQLPARPGAAPYRLRHLEGVDLYVIHYTASPPETSVLDVATFQTGPASQLEFPSIAYHLVVDASGALSFCQDLDVRTWGSDGVGVNDRAVHACYTGNQQPSDLQLAGLRAGLLIAQRKLGRLLQVEGHKDRSKTACPGPTWPSWKGAIVN